MSPNYVLRYAKAHGLKPPVRDVKSCIITKLTRVLSEALPEPVTSSVRQGSAERCAEVFPHLVSTVDIILTSPPYLAAQTYAKDNWLRLWLLGYDYRDIKPTYIETGSVEQYGKRMTDVFQALARMLKPGGVLVCVAGDVKLPGSARKGQCRIFRTGQFLATICRSEQVGLDIEKREKHIVVGENRYFHALSSTNGHAKHDLVERVFIARKRNA
jgi:DNA modification methylase